MYHYIRKFDPSLPYFNFLHKKNFDKQLKLFNKNLLNINDSFENFLNSKNKLLLTFDDGLKDHYNVFKTLIRHGYKGVFFIPSYPYIKKDFLDVHKIHLILGKLKLKDILNGLKKNKINVDFKKIKFPEKNYQLKNVKNLNEKKKINIKIYLNFFLKKNQNNIINNLFNYFFDSKSQKKIFKNFYLNKKNIKEMHNSGMIIGGHSYSHKLLKCLSKKDQRVEIEKNIKHLNSLVKKKIKYFAYPYGGKSSYNRSTIKILNKNNIKYIFSTGNKKVIKSSNLNYIPRINCNKFKFGQIYKY